MLKISMKYTLIYICWNRLLEAWFLKTLFFLTVIIQLHVFVKKLQKDIKSQYSDYFIFILFFKWICRVIYLEFGMIWHDDNEFESMLMTGGKTWNYGNQRCWIFTYWMINWKWFDVLVRKFQVTTLMLKIWCEWFLKAG